MKFISAILKIIYSVFNGIYEIFTFLYGFLEIIADVLNVLPFQLISILSSFFILIITVIFYKIIKS